jgi:hypothetical protein
MKERSLSHQVHHLVAVTVAAALGACATPQAREINLDHAVEVANAAARSSLNPGGPLRVLIATEKDVRSVKRCLDDDHDPSYVQSVREKVAGRRLYVVRYPLPPVTLEDGDSSMVGTEPCVLIDRDTGEVLGVFPD